MNATPHEQAMDELRDCCDEVGEIRLPSTREFVSP
jgi:hypothetical protein